MGSVGENNKRTAEPESSIVVVEQHQETDDINTDGHPDAPIQDARLQELEEDSSSTELPRFVQEERGWKRWKWVPYPVRRFAKATVKWSKGPTNPRDYKINPLFPVVQHAPLWLLDTYLPRKKHRIWAYLAYLAIWLMTFALVMRQGILATEIAGWGEPADIGCGNTYWVSGNRCGLNGNDCRPFNGSGFAFRCPATCITYQVLNPRAVGDQEIIYRPLVIGGPSDTTETPIYRGDSFICGAAIHAGVISNSKGGCGVVRVIGKSEDYASSDNNGIKSVSFDSYFPLSFTFEGELGCAARDPRWALLGVSVAFTAVLSLFTTSPGVFLFTIFTGMFIHVGMASDPPGHYSIPDLITNLIGKYLPAMFTVWVMYDKMGVRRTLKGLTAQIEKTVLWLGACWVGALTNYTFDFIPIQRLTPHDIQQQPGAKAALAIIIIVLVVLVVKQIWYFRQEGRLIRYGKLYLMFIGGIIVCLILPDFKLRIHHYILALLLLPGTSMQTRPALLYQGLLIGFFINGIARWGWDPVLQTAYSLQGDAPSNSPLPALISAPAIQLGANLSTITFGWKMPTQIRYDGISVLVNDVERFRGYYNDDGSWIGNWTWTRNGDQDVREYFRFAYMEGSKSWDYTRAGTWTADGEWLDMPPGPSRVRSRSVDGEERVVFG